MEGAYLHMKFMSEDPFCHTLATMFVKHYALSGNKVRKSYFSHKGQSQGHKVIDLGVFSIGIIGGVCMTNMKFLSLMVRKL